MRLSIGFSLSFVRQAMAWDANLLDLFCELVAEGRPWVMGWRESTHLYTYSDEAPYPVDIVDVTKSRSSRRSRQKESGENEREAPPYLLPRHWQLSDDVGYRFSNRNWDNYPLYADTYASWIANTSGDFVLLGWDFETFGEHHRQDTGIFEFMHALPSELAQHGVDRSWVAIVAVRRDPIRCHAGHHLSDRKNARAAAMIPIPASARPEAIADGSSSAPVPASTSR